MTIAVMVCCVLFLMNLTGTHRVSRNVNHPLDEHTVRPTTQAARIKTMANNWEGSVNFDLPFTALSPLSETSAEKLDVLFNPADDYWGLPRSDGVDMVAGLCGACHSLAIVMQQRQTEEGWNYLFDWMIEKQGMAAITGTTRDEIITYLSREFGEE